MKKFLGQSTWEFSEVKILGSATAVGPLEGEGPLKNDFDVIHEDLHIGQDTWEKAERKLLEEAFDLAIKKSGVPKDKINLMVAGDLLNQIISASFSANYLQLPFLGVYGACSTSMESLAIAASFVEAGFADNVVAGCSSHNATAEKQYRYPTEYGSQKPPYAQWTVTGAGAAVVGKGLVGSRVKYATIGKVVDMGITDPFDMGSAMAPAAVETIAKHFNDTGRTPNDYDLIVTGDLAGVGYPIAKQMLLERGYDMSKVYNDCGLMIYSSTQKVFAGGSGCASSAVVTYGHILKQLKERKLNKVLVVATGALLSPITFQQSESIPCIAHAVAIENEEE